MVSAMQTPSYQYEVYERAIQICSFPLILPEYINLLQFFLHVSAFHYL